MDTRTARELAHRGARIGLATAVAELAAEPVMAAIDPIAPELAHRCALRVMSDLRGFAVVTEVGGAGASVVEDELPFAQRIAGLIASSGRPALAQRVETILIARAGRRAMVAVASPRDGMTAEVAIEVAVDGRGDDVLALAVQLDPGIEAARRDLARWCGMLGGRPVAVGSRGRTPIAGRVTTIAMQLASTPAAQARIAAVLGELNVTAPQRALFDDIHPVFAAGAPGLLVRIAVADGRVVPEVAIEYPNASAEDVVQIWTSLEPPPRMPSRMGGLVGALGASTGMFEIRFRDVEPPLLEMTFSVPGAKG